MTEFSQHQLFGLILGQSIESQSATLELLCVKGFRDLSQTGFDAPGHMILSKSASTECEFDYVLYLEIDGRGAVSGLRLLIGLSDSLVSKMGIQDAATRLQGVLNCNLGTPLFFISRSPKEASDDEFISSGFWRDSSQSQISKKCECADLDSFIRSIKELDPGPCALAQISASGGGLIASIELTHILKQDEPVSKTDKLREFFLNLSTD